MSRPVAEGDELLVACFCAEWCGACREFASDFESVARAWPNARFAWIDIEDHPDVLGDDDIETFPTLLVADARGVAFYGVIEPRSATLQALIAQASGTTLREPMSEVARRVRLHVQSRP